MSYLDYYCCYCDEDLNVIEFDWNNPVIEQSYSSDYSGFNYDGKK